MAVEKWGAQAQIDMMIEEMSELTKALMKLKRAGEDKSQEIENVHDELADVKIMLTQLEHHVFNKDEVARFFEKKMIRLEGRLKKYIFSAKSVQIIKFNEESARGRIYTSDSFIDFKDFSVLYGEVERSDNMSVQLSNCGAWANMIKKDDGIYLENIQLIGGKNGLKFKELFDLGYFIAPKGVGNVANDGVVTRYDILGFFLTNEPSFHDIKIRR